MQIDHGQQQCPGCGGASLQFSAVFHHMVCAYVGPEYDFVQAEAYRCPKCRHGIAASDGTCEIVGTSARCQHCLRELVVSPAPP